MGEEPERLRARLAEIRELLFTGFYDQEDDRREPWTDFGEAVGMGEWLLAEVERLGEVCEMHHRAEQGWADAQAEVERLAEERDDWKCEAELRGLPKELMQRLHRAEAECERLAGRVEVAEKNADISADDAERWEAKALRLARRVSALAEAASALYEFLWLEKQTREPPSELLDAGYVALETSADYEKEEELTVALGAALADVGGSE